MYLDEDKLSETLSEKEEKLPTSTFIFNHNTFLLQKKQIIQQIRSLSSLFSENISSFNKSKIVSSTLKLIARNPFIFSERIHASTKNVANSQFLEVRGNSIFKI